MPSSRRQQKRGRVRHTMKPTKTVSVLGMPGSSHQHAMSLGKSRKVSVTCLPSRAIRVVESEPSISNHRQVIMRIMKGCCEMLQSNHGHVWTAGWLPVPTVGLSPCCRMSRLGEPSRSLISRTTIKVDHRLAINLFSYFLFVSPFEAKVIIGRKTSTSQDLEPINCKHNRP